MRRLSTGKRAANWVLVAAFGVVGSCSWTSYAAALEDQQQAAGAIVTRAKELGKVQAERSKAAQEAEKADKPVRTLGEILSVCPKETRNEFMESLAFLNGGVASAHTAGIKKCLSSEQMNDVLMTIGHTSARTKPGALADKPEICRCGQITKIYGCRGWNNSSCDPAYCHGPC